jgi:hypothetical protein
VGVGSGSPEALNGTKPVRELACVGKINPLEGALAVLSDERSVVYIDPEAFTELIAQAESPLLILLRQPIKGDLGSDDLRGAFQADLLFGILLAAGEPTAMPDADVVVEPA